MRHIVKVLAPVCALVGVVALATPSEAAFSANETWTSNPYFGNYDTQFTDVTGDGLADAVAINDTGITVRRSTGSLFSGNEAWTSGPYYGSNSTQLADVTGDGRADAIAINDTGITVRRST
jgi:hypothetical protein